MSELAESTPALFMSKAGMVTSLLRQMIMDGELTPGGSVPTQRQLAERFEVSPTPVREALRRLESEGLITYDPHRRSSVVEVDFGASKENYRIRAALESLAVEIAIENVTDAQIEELEAIERRLEQESDDPERVRQLNNQLHFQIYEAANSHLLVVLLRRLWHGFPNGPQAPRPVEETISDHRAIIAAIRDRDGERAAGLVREHVLGGISYLK